MARILYGVMGNTYGHIMRSLAIATRLSEHEFYFVGGGRVPEILHNYPVFQVPVLRTVHHQQKVSISRTVAQIIQRGVEIPWIVRSLTNLIEQWQPDLAICDREFFLPIAAHRTGLKCLSIDHSHILKDCVYPVPMSQKLSWSLAMINDCLLFDFTKHNLIVSFFHPPQKKCSSSELFPPVLRPDLFQIKPSLGDHVLVYQTSSTFPELIQALSHLEKRVIVYGFRNQYEIHGNLIFKPFNFTSILEDLASCAYCIVNGGHNVICEALYFGKPIFCFPVSCLFEQFINAWHVAHLGYGDFSRVKHPKPEQFYRFEQKLENYQTSIQKNFQDGTEKVVQRIEEIIREANHE